MFPTIRADELAKATEQRGFESMFFPEYTRIPTSLRALYPLGGELPREHSHTIDSIVAMRMAASAPQNLNAATGICLVIKRDPIVPAKEVASIDQVSNCPPQKITRLNESNLKLLQFEGRRSNHRCPKSWSGG
jgi:alkanesulfonate monooxygenase SsuD/methylene tetrahydromethanopterin reductase-like flavin-dependent oxidoreductase (luciferase family)